MPSQDRVAALTDLVTRRVGVAEALGRLHGMPWDAEELVVLTVAHVRHVLTEYAAGRLTTQELAEWAEAVECRDDLGREAGQERWINDVLFRLANPALS